MRIRGVGFGVLVALLVPPQALAANQTVTATTSSAFSPKDVSVNVGEIGHLDQRRRIPQRPFRRRLCWIEPPDPVDPWPMPVSRTFNTVGTFRYVCEAHEVSDNMTGTVTVLASGAPPGPGPGPGSPQPVAADKVKPTLKLSGQRKQRALRRRAVLVAVEVNEASTVVATGTVSVPGAGKVIRLKKASKQLAAGAKATLKLKLPKQASKALRRAFANRTRLTARLTVTARDAAGNKRSAKRKIALRT